MGGIKEAFARWFLGGIVREIADGKRGKGLATIYWRLAGKKRTISAIAGLLFAALVAWRPDLATSWAPTMTAVLGFAVAISIADADWKVAPPPAEWSKAMAEILSYGPVLSAAVAFVAETLLSMPATCQWCPGWAEQIQWYAGAIGAVTMWLAARLNVPPQFPRRRSNDVIALPPPTEAK